MNDTSTAADSTVTPIMDGVSTPTSTMSEAITPVPETIPLTVDIAAPVTPTASIDTSMTSTEAPTTGSTTPLEWAVQNSTGTAAANIQIQTPSINSGATREISQTRSMTRSNSFTDETSSNTLEGIGAVFGIMYMAVILLMLVSQYVLSRKLKLEYSWLALIPVVNVYNLVKIAGHAGWKVILAIVPFVNFFYIAFSLNPAISRRTGHGLGVSIGLFFLYPIVFPIIAFMYEGTDDGAN